MTTAQWNDGVAEFEAFCDVMVFCLKSLALTLAVVGIGAAVLVLAP
jgi:hypothetical protein